MKSKIKFGSLVCSISGHDKNKIYFVIKVEDKFAYCCDGRVKTLGSPKKKNLKHLKFLNVFYESLLEKFNNNKFYDYEIATIIKNYSTKCTNLNSHT